MNEVEDEETDSSDEFWRAFGQMGVVAVGQSTAAMTDDANIDETDMGRLDNDLASVSQEPQLRNSTDSDLTLQASEPNSLGEQTNRSNEDNDQPSQLSDPQSQRQALDGGVATASPNEHSQRNPDVDDIQELPGPNLAASSNQDVISSASGGGNNGQSTAGSDQRKHVTFDLGANHSQRETHRPPPSPPPPPPRHWFQLDTDEDLETIEQLCNLWRWYSQSMLKLAHCCCCGLKIRER